MPAIARPLRCDQRREKLDKRKAPPGVQNTGEAPALMATAERKNQRPQSRSLRPKDKNELNPRPAEPYAIISSANFPRAVDDDQNCCGPCQAFDQRGNESQPVHSFTFGLRSKQAGLAGHDGGSRVLLPDVTSDRFEDESSQLSIRNVTVCECSCKLDPRGFLEKVVVNSPFYLLAEIESIRLARQLAKVSGTVLSIVHDWQPRICVARHPQLGHPLTVGICHPVTACGFSCAGRPEGWRTSKPHGGWEVPCEGRPAQA